MAKGISLHIGLNHVDPNHYQDGDGEPWDGELGACEFDAKDMADMAKKCGFASSTILRSKQATAAAVIAAIRDAAKKLKAGDFFLLTYSGHGGQVPDTNDDERSAPNHGNDRMDETWVLFDRELVDDELYVLWSKFKAGVRIVVLSDSCHSGTVVRALPPSLLGLPPGTRLRRMPLKVAERTYKKNKKLYDGIQKANPTAEQSKIGATVLLISGCQDSQFSADGDRNGLFTATLKKTWRGGKFAGTYRAMRDHMAAVMPEYQTPNYFVVGKANAIFENQVPFKI